MALTQNRPIPRGAYPAPHMDDDIGLITTELIIEVDEEEFSVLLGPDGLPLRYASRKLGHIGFTQLKERP